MVIKNRDRRQANLSALLLTSFFIFTGSLITSGQRAWGDIVSGDSNTQVNRVGDRFDIEGGVLSGNQQNLFQTLREFNLDAGQIANFLTSPQIVNILTRVNGGHASIINGLIQLTGSGHTNLYLINPVGIIFGAEASVNVPADFVVTTANAIGFDNGFWFDAIADNHYERLNGNPTQFAFDLAQPGNIINAANLSVPGNLALVGGTVINTGSLMGSNIAITAVPGNRSVRIHYPGNLVSIEVEPPRDSQGNPQLISPLDLPQLLTEGGNSLNTGLSVVNGQVQITDTQQRISTDSGTFVTTGNLLTRQGGLVVDNTRISTPSRLSSEDTSLFIRTENDITINAPRLAISDTTIETHGGNFTGIASRNSITLINSSINTLSGNLELSGRGRNSAPGVNSGINILGSSLLANDQGDISLNGSIPSDNSAQSKRRNQGISISSVTRAGETRRTKISVEEGHLSLVGQGGGSPQGDNNVGIFINSADIESTGTGKIEINGLAGPVNINRGGGHGIRLQDTTISSVDGDIAIQGEASQSGFGVWLLGNTALETSGEGNIQLQGNANLGSEGIGVSDSLINSNEAGDITLTADGIGLFGSTQIKGDSNIQLQPLDPANDITLGGETSEPENDPRLNLDQIELDKIQNGFASVIIGHDNGEGTITIAEDGVSFEDPTLIQTPEGEIVIEGPIVTNDDSFIQFIPEPDGIPEPDLPSPVLPPETPESPVSAIPTPIPAEPIVSPALMPENNDNFLSNTTLQMTEAIILQALEGEIVTDPLFQSAFISLNQPSGQDSSTQTAPVPLSTTAITTNSSLDLFNFSQVEAEINTAFVDYLGIAQVPAKSLQEAKAILKENEKQLGIKSALIYILFKPPTAPDTFWTFKPSTQRDNNRNRQGDRLQITLITAEDSVIQHNVDATRQQVLEVVQQFQSTITNPRRPTAYLKSAQQLHQWFIEPIEQDLQARGIQNLLFSLDTGIRSVPMAALHRRAPQTNPKKRNKLIQTTSQAKALEQGFLIERYSLGLIPSLSLTDTRYVDIRDSQVLAMGASTFEQLNPLPSVPVELSLITQDIWSGESFLNEAFTLDNFKTAHATSQYQVIHLATHANFEPGALSNSYIQLWENRLLLNELRDLSLGDPQVELLILSACRTALGDAESELGFAGAAVLAEVKSVLGSYWEVRDEATLGLMTRFYQRLREVPMKAEALRQAQLSLLYGDVRIDAGKLMLGDQPFTLPEVLKTTKVSTLAHPYYWSSFTVIGSPW